MALISVSEANAWADKFKLNLDSLDTELEASVAAQVLATIATAYDSSSWTSYNNTPSLVRKIVAMMYVGWYFQRTYSEDEETNSYGLLLIAQAERLMQGLVDGSLSLPEVPGGGYNTSSPSFYPTDSSSAQYPTSDDMSLGGPVFSMGKVW